MGEIHRYKIITIQDKTLTAYIWYGMPGIQHDFLEKTKMIIKIFRIHRRPVQGRAIWRKHTCWCVIICFFFLHLIAGAGSTGQSTCGTDVCCYSTSIIDHTRRGSDCGDTAGSCCGKRNPPGTIGQRRTLPSAVYEGWHNLMDVVTTIFALNRPKPWFW